MATKKLTVDDFTNQPQALTAEDVNNQDARTRTWQSLDYMYGKQRKDSREQFAKAQSQSWQQALARGMQRSSYATAVAANLAKQGIDAENDIYAAQIADYQNRIGQIEQQELENDWREREFAANRDDAMWNRNYQTSQFEYQKARDVVGDQQWQKQFDETVREFDLQHALQTAISGGSGGGGGGSGAGDETGYPGSYYPQQSLDEELAIRDTAQKLANSAKQTRNSAINQIYIDQYQRQINALAKKLPNASSNSERTNINNQIKALQQKINGLK